MTTNIYQAPEAELQLVDSENGDFYAVAPRKFLLLFFTTFGYYAVYWFYQNWTLYKRKNDFACWPVMRAIFSIFFTHSLFRIIEHRLNAQKLSHDWLPELLATSYVAITIIARIVDRLIANNIGSPFTDLVLVVAVIIAGVVLYRAQLAINVLCGDDAVSSNSKLTPVNYLWVTFGMVFTALVLVGMFFPGLVA